MHAHERLACDAYNILRLSFRILLNSLHQRLDCWGDVLSDRARRLIYDT